MIVRILGDGQYELSDELSPEFVKIDDVLVGHVEAGDDEAFRRDLAALVALVRKGQRLADDQLQTSDGVVPQEHATLAEVRALLSEEQSG